MNDHTDLVNHPPHYQGHPVLSGECIHYTRNLAFADGNAFKYLWRFAHKGTPVMDLEKTIWYLTDAARNDTRVLPLSIYSEISQRMSTEMKEHEDVMSTPEDAFNLIWAQLLYDIAHAGHQTEKIIEKISGAPMTYARIIQE